MSPALELDGVVGDFGSAGIASMRSRHGDAAAMFFNWAEDKGGWGLVTGESFSAAAFHSLMLTCCPCGVTSSAVHNLVSTRRSGYSYP